MLKLVHAMNMDFSSVKDYYDSFDDKWYDLNSYAITQVAFGHEMYLRYICNYSGDLYYLVDDQNPQYIIGYGSVIDSVFLDARKTILNGGNISYSIRPSERNKGYGRILFYLLLNKCEELGMREICVSFLSDNIASRKIIEYTDNRLEKMVYDDDFNKYAYKYWVRLHPKIKSRTQRLARRYFSDSE